MQTQTKFNAFMKKGTVLHNYAHIFDLLSKLRQAADHPYLVVHAADRDYKGTTVAEHAEQSGEMQDEDAEEEEEEGDGEEMGGEEAVAEYEKVSSAVVAICGICQDGIVAEECAVGGAA